MGMLSNFFSGGSGGHETGLNLVGDDTDWQGAYNNIARMPKSVSREGLNQQVARAEKSEASAYLVAQYAKQKQRQLQSLGKKYQAIGQLAQAGMRTSTQMGRVDTRVGRAHALWDIERGVNNTSVNTYRAALMDAGTVLNVGE